MQGRWQAQLAFALALICLCSGLCPTCTQAEDLSDWTNPEQYLYFSGADIWRNGASVHGGLLWSPRGLDNPGPVLKLFASEGAYSYLSGTTSVYGINLTASFMPGWHFKQGTADITLFAGLDFQFHELIPADPSNSLAGSHIGGRIGADLWWQPRKNFMATTSFSVSSVGHAYWMRAASGWWVFDEVWAGPEFTASGDTAYRQFRIGGHLTGWRVEVFDFITYEWSIGAGYVEDNNDRSGFYGRFALLNRR